MAVNDVIGTVLEIFIVVVFGWAFFQAIWPLGFVPAAIFGVSMLVLIIALVKSFLK